MGCISNKQIVQNIYQVCLTTNTITTFKSIKPLSEGNIKVFVTEHKSFLLLNHKIFSTRNVKEENLNSISIKTRFCYRMETVQLQLQDK